MGSYQYICCFYRSICAKLLFKSSSDLCIGCKNEIVSDERHVFGRNWWGLEGIWISMPVSDALAFVTAVISLMIYIKKVSKEHPIANKVAE